MAGNLKSGVSGERKSESAPVLAREFDGRVVVPWTNNIDQEFPPVQSDWSKSTQLADLPGIETSRPLVLKRRPAMKPGLDHWLRSLDGK